MNLPLRLEFEVAQSGDANQLDESTRELANEIRALDIEELNFKKAAEKPTGMKAGEVVTIGAFALTVLPLVLPQLISLLKEWCLRKPDRSIKITCKSENEEMHLEFDLDGITKQDLEAIVDTIRSLNEVRLRMERRIAILIGNGAFNDKRLDKLFAPAFDVHNLQRVLAEPRIGGYETVEIIDQGLRNALVGISVAAKGVTYQDTLLLYYSGHGVLDDSGKLYLATNDTDSDHLSATAISAQFVAQELDRCQSRRQIIILDCCHSGAFDRSGRKSATASRMNAAVAFKGEREGRGRFLLTATDETQFAYDKDKLKGKSDNSVFTNFLIEGLQTGDADIDQDGQISFDDLHSYVSMRASREMIKQTPYKWAYRADGKVFVARNIKSRGFDIRSLGALSDDLQVAIISAHTDIRLGAVAALSKLVRDKDASIAENALLALAHLSSDPDNMVSTASLAGRHNIAEIYAVPSVSSKGRTANIEEADLRDIALGPNVALTMIRIPAGKFLMGSRPEDKLAQKNEFPQHAVHLEEYWISRAPITIQQFSAFVSTSNYTPASQRVGGVRKAFSHRNRRYEVIGYNWRNPFGEEAARSLTREHPVVLVNWHDAMAFCKWASAITGLIVDLPTEAEWEKAGRGRDGRIWPWGNTAVGETLCNFDERMGKTTPVGAYSPSGDSFYGCVDMAGNVWEWTNSEPHPYPFIDKYAGSTHTFSGERILRGGSWRVKAYRVRCAFRKPWKIQECIDGHGFRVIAKGLA